MPIAPSKLDWHTAADAVEHEQYIPALSGLLLWLSRSVSVAQIERAIEVGGDIVALFPIDQYLDYYSNALMRIQEDVWKVTSPIATMLALRGSSMFFAAPVKLERRFDLQDERAQEFIKTRTGNRIRQIDVETKANIRAIILEAFQKGGHPREQARKIAEHINLLPNHRAAYERYRDSQMKQANTQRQRDAATRRIAAHYNKLLRHRAVTIARTETMMASNTSTMQRWEQMAADGQIPAGTKMRWIAGKDEKLCDICAAMVGKLFDFGKDIQLPNGNYISHPPAHPRCRCVLSLVKPDILDEMEGIGTLEEEVAAAIQRMTYQGTPKLDMSKKPGDRISDDIDDVRDLNATMAALYPNIDFALGQANAKAILPSMKQFDRLASDWPLAVKSMKRVHVREPEYFENVHGGKAVIAHASYNGHYIEFNAKYYKNLDMTRADAAYNQSSGWHVKSSKGDPAASVMTHEFGHTIEGWLTGQHTSPDAYPSRLGYSSLLPMPGASGHAMFSKVFETGIANMARKKAPSDYGKTNYHEAWAESFAAYYHQKRSEWGAATKETVKLMEFAKAMYPAAGRTKMLTPDDMVERMAKWEPGKPFNLDNFIKENEWVYIGDVPKMRPEHRRVFDLLIAENNRQRKMIADFLGWQEEWLR